MRRIALYLIVALLAFGAGTVSVALWPSAIKPQGEIVNIKANAASPAPAEAFSYTGGVHTEAVDGCLMINKFKALADGSQISTLTKYCDSPAQAVRALRKDVKDAMLVGERSVLKGFSGEQVGERVVVWWRPSARAWKRASILWTWNNRYRSIDAESLERALEFEKNGKR
jgi:hypothetical protein